MKIISFFALLLAIITFTVSCSKEIDDPNPDENESIIPQKFRIDIPDAISYSTKSGLEGDKINGGDLYKMLGTFIAVGESAAKFVEDVILVIRLYDINKAMSFTYLSKEDQRTKEVVVEENVMYNNKTYEFSLTMTDIAYKDSADKGMALQVFWNTGMVEGIAIIKPYNIDVDSTDTTDIKLMYMVEYSEIGQDGYDAQMTVSISGHTLKYSEKYGIDNLKMWVGKKGNEIDIRGNSNHPNAFLVDSTETGFSWAFVASADASKNIAVAELGLPSSISNITTRAEILDTCSVRNVLEKAVKSWWIIENPNITVDWTKPDNKAILDGYLQESNPPAYFSNIGFVKSETAPNNSYEQIQTNIESLVPFNPSQINQLQLSFKLIQ
ncbi:MAG: hypothetical protein IPO21_16575 [Bacteroidales bacterium]|nr:hypothetical protein [Bacteroidales bacterium]